MVDGEGAAALNDRDMGYSGFAVIFLGLHGLLNLEAWDIWPEGLGMARERHETTKGVIELLIGDRTGHLNPMYAYLRGPPAFPVLLLCEKLR